MKDTFGARAFGRDNNFNLMRMVAALCVIMSHSYTIAYGKDYPEPLSGVLPGYSLGRLCVWTFFVISGFLISQSFDRRKHLVDFVLARFLRISPGLFISLVFTALVVGPLFTTLPLGSYLRSPEPLFYIIKNMILMLRQNSLPELFLQNPYPGQVNASLWTLYYEALCYALVAAVGLAMLVSRFSFVVFLFGFCVLEAGMSLYKLKHYDAFMSHTMTAHLHELLLPFVLGMIWYRLRASVPVSMGIVASAVAVIVVWKWLALPFFIEVFVMCWSYLVIYMAFARVPLLLRYNRLGDYSYGVYIYSYPLQ